MFAVLLLCVLLNYTDAVRYRLTDEEYARMPPLIQLDSYEACQQDEGALYCMSEYKLVSDKPSKLLDMIQEYSEHHVAHFNHTKIRYGICVKQTCKKFYNQHKGDLRLTLEACLNESLTEQYDLKVKLLDENCKDPRTHAKEIDRLDIVIGAVCVILLVVNVVGSICDYYFETKKSGRVVTFLQCFSVLRNWKHLMTPGGGGQDPRLERLKGFHGLRVITMCLVIMCHSILAILVFIDNPEYVEEAYSTKPYWIIFNGTLIMQTFLISSAFLLIYNSLLYSEKNTVSWFLLPKFLIFRWLRLTPSYGIVLALTMTWFAHLSSGPMWNKYVEVEMMDCRHYWWRNILYINNYTEKSDCMGHCWYLAADTQLYCLAVLVFLACRTARSRKIVLSILFAAGVILPALHVYFQDLDGVQMMSPENTLNVFMTDPHFKLVYSRGHTNIAGYAIGMTVAYLVYHWQKQGADYKKYRTLFYRTLYWSSFIVGIWCCYIGGIFYEGPRHSVFLRALFAAFLGPVFGLLVGVIAVGFIFKCEDLYRGVLEWRGWTQASRLTYSAYLLHVVIIKNHVARETNMIPFSILLVVQNGLIILTEAFIGGFILWILVEAPINNVVRDYLMRRREQKKKIK